jgi:hypothetical protein
MEDSNLLTIAILLIIGYIALYLGGKKYLETFTDNRDSPEGVPPTVFANTTGPGTSEGNALPENPPDEYEVSAVFHNEGSREVSKQQLNDAMTRYPIDWSTQGPNSQNFQEKQAQNQPSKNRPVPYQNQETQSSVPSSMEDEERKILQTYQPNSSKGLLEYSPDDVKSLVDKVYTRKGLIPVIVKSKQGPNIWEITEVKEKNPTIVWEDGARQKMDMRGEETIEVPRTATDSARGLNPFASPRERVGNGKSDVREWSAGVDRMFVPSYPVPAWN